MKGAGRLFALILLAATGLTQAQTMNITYYNISSSDPDANALCCSGPLPEVTSTLGPHGLPMLLSGYGGVTPHDVNSFGELTYWSPAFNSHVTQTGTGVVTLPYANGAFYPPNGTGSYDGGVAGYSAAVLTGSLFAPTAESISFTIASDDNAFVYLDGTVVCNDGGVHGAGGVVCTSSIIGPGSHMLQVFYDDLNQVGAVLDFKVNTEGVTVQAVPEPETYALMLTGLAFLGLLARRRRQSAPW
jgi:hypothetical protein